MYCVIGNKKRGLVKYVWKHIVCSVVCFLSVYQYAGDHQIMYEVKTACATEYVAQVVASYLFYCSSQADIQMQNSCVHNLYAAESADIYQSRVKALQAQCRVVCRASNIHNLRAHGGDISLYHSDGHHFTVTSACIRSMHSVLHALYMYPEGVDRCLPHVDMIDSADITHIPVGRTQAPPERLDATKIRCVARFIASRIDAIYIAPFRREVACIDIISPTAPVHIYAYNALIRTDAPEYVHICSLNNSSQRPTGFHGLL